MFIETLPVTSKLRKSVMFEVNITLLRSVP
jgi:hypothetical protein